MPKFSAYMRGEKGSKGDVGQASLIDQFINIEDLPNHSTLDPTKNHAYYVKKDDGIHLYFSELAEEWQDLGLVTISFSTEQYGSISTLPWTPEGTLPQITITPHENQSITSGFKSFDFHFDIPEGQPAGISTVSASAINIEFNNQPQVSITTSGNNWEKNFHFDFEIPKGEPAGFGDMEGEIEMLSSQEDPFVEIIPNEESPNNAKDFNFYFGIPQGIPAGFGEISVSTTQIDSTRPAEVSMTTSGEDSAKNFHFDFKIPQGIKGNPGDSLGVYSEINFLSTDLDINNNIFWENNTLHIQRDENAKIPIFILNNENNNIAATFEINENEILYKADSRFSGSLYLISKANFPIFKVGKTEVVSNDNDAYVDAYYENENDPYTITLDFYLPKGTIQEEEEDIYNNEQLLELLDLKADRNELGSLSFIDDAPSNDKIYGRKNGDWEEIINNNSEGSTEFSGRGIESIEFESASGLIDTYTINYSDGTTSNFEIKNGENGRGILNINVINKNPTTLIDTYRINYTDGTYTDFYVKNGSNGSGEGGNTGGSGSIVTWDSIDNVPTTFKTSLDELHIANWNDPNISFPPNFKIGWSQINNKPSKFAPDTHYHNLARNANSGGVDGILGVKNGGLGVDATTISAKYVFAAPYGADGTPTFRKLVAADIPNLNASKITAGQLKIAQGGTGKAEVSPHTVLIGPKSGTLVTAPTWRSLVAADIPTLPLSKVNITYKATDPGVDSELGTGKILIVYNK